MDQVIANLNAAVNQVLPEVVLLATVCVQFLAGPFLVGESGEAPAGLRHRWGGFTVVALLTAGWLWFDSTPAAVVGPNHLTFVNDHLTWFIRGLSLAAGFVLVLITWNQVDDGRAAETHACLLVIVCGMNFLAAANDLVTLFLALEMVSIPTYVFLYLPRRDAEAQEATTKYFLLSIFSSALVLYGLSLFYGAVGTTHLGAIRDSIREHAGTLPPWLLAGLVLLIAGLAFRITAVPFHFYAPDVFQGSPTPGAAMLSFVPKIAGFVALIRVLVVDMNGHETELLLRNSERVVWWLAVLTMSLGNLLALLQTNLKRLLAYSSIAHAGYMLVGLYVAGYKGAQVDGVVALLFYLAVYGAMTLGVFTMLVYLQARQRGAETLDDLHGLSRVHPAAALLLMVFLFSLTGLPPTAGFVGKFQLFVSVWSLGNNETSRWLAYLMAANAAVGAWYYLRVISVMYLHEPTSASPRQPAPHSLDEMPAVLAGGACAALVLALFIAPQWLLQPLERISGSPAAARTPSTAAAQTVEK